MIIDITEHRAFRQRDGARDVDPILAINEQTDAIIQNLSRTLAMASQTVQTLRAMPAPGVIKLVTEQRDLIEQLLRNLEPLEPQLMRANDSFQQQYRNITNDLRRITYEMDEALRYCGTFTAQREVVVTYHSKSAASGIAEIVLIAIVASTLIGVVRAVLGG